MKTIKANCHVQGYLEHGYYELNLTEIEFEEFQNLDASDQEEWIRSQGRLTIDGFSVRKIQIYEHSVMKAQS